MAKIGSAGRGVPGAVVVKAGERFTGQNSHNRDELQFQPCADECIYRLRRALRMGRLEPGSWGFNFTRSILRHSKRRNWEPTPKQLHSMRGLLADLAEPSESLIDDGGDDDRAA